MVYKLDTRTYPPARHTDYLEYCSSFHWTLCSRALVLTGPYPSPQLRLLFTHWGDYDLILLGYHLGPYILVGCSAPGFYEIVKAISTICGPFRPINISIFLPPSFCHSFPAMSEFGHILLLISVLALQALPTSSSCPPFTSFHTVYAAAGPPIFMEFTKH